jgi:hypothetical protein
MDENVARQKIRELLTSVNNSLAEAESIAREANVSFMWDGPTYGMGGYFDPNRGKNEWGDECDGWLASSMSC